ncbi:hypothetical protein BKA82DRAFT_20513 [Pisolithus tinctorius]|uniref:Uncharacterized protein n=1 Tax=Pisolithus tinctorius Marx 270 TaxID=870435 RepID=A0A0C3PPW8_PISTI|nr:hypothetical protein BKA82DRAFT_20513 [Pisolithus tinctorius]KIO10991.1 hypothetical protein M404DRAFT_20513 [Pisolithus tinctorius Marx 270]
MQAQRYRSIHVTFLRPEPLSLPLKGLWPANFSIPSFVSTIHFDTVVVERGIISLCEPVQLLTCTSKLCIAESLANFANDAQIWLKRGDLHGCWGSKCDDVCPFGMECVIYVRAEDARTQVLDISRMKMFVVKVVPVETDSKTLKERNC